MVVLVVITAGTLLYYYTRPSPAPAPSAKNLAGGFAAGRVVTFHYNGTNTFLCTPSLGALFPHDPNASADARSAACGIGNASQTAVPQIPQWYLVPAFAGLSVFGLPGYNATSSGFPTRNGSAVTLDCGAGASPGACLDHPAVAFSPFFAQFEVQAGLSGGVEGLPLGVLPFPAHDMVENYTRYPLVPWGTIVVYVLDPNIVPNRATGLCSQLVPSNLSDPTGNCLNSTAQIYAAAGTCSSAAAVYAAPTSNPVGWVLTHEDHVSPCAQVYVQAPGALSSGGPSALLNSNLYEPYSVTPGVPPTFSP